MLGKIHKTIRTFSSTMDNLMMLGRLLEKETGSKVGIGKVIDIVVHIAFGNVAIPQMVEHALLFKEELLDRKPRSDIKEK